MWIQVGNLITAALQPCLTSLDAIKTTLGVNVQASNKRERASFRNALSLYWRLSCSSCKSVNPFLFILPIHRQAETPFPSGVPNFQIYFHFFPRFPLVFLSVSQVLWMTGSSCSVNLWFFNIYFFNDKSSKMQIMPPKNQSTIQGSQWSNIFIPW